jgi:hypothetical protein
MSPQPAPLESLRTLSIDELVRMTRDAQSPLVREHAARMLYLQGGVDALAGKANAKFSELPR